MPAFALDERYYFMPGFPEMSHPMVMKILAKHIPEKRTIYRHTLTAHCKENEFIDIMEQMPKEVEFSSLPKLYSDGWRVSISVSSQNSKLAQISFDKYIDLLEEKNIVYALQDEA
jgi:molybdopterin-biosynthesis enzyme MoeA-like protein